MSISRDEQMAKLSLELDPRERENLLAEHRRWEIRRRAIKRADEGSLIEPRSFDPAMPFTPVQCVTCGVKLTTMNHAQSLTCHECVAHEERIQFNAQTTVKFEEAQRAVRQAKKLAESKEAAKAVVFWVLVAIGGAALLAYAADKVLFWLGGALP